MEKELDVTNSGLQHRKVATTKPTNHVAKVTQRVPTAKPSFTIKDIKKAIPAHCFERSALKSSAYLAADLAGIAALFYAQQFFEPLGQALLPSNSWLITWPLWVFYWAFQGFLGLGLWVVAHECGHQAYSSSQIINDTVGLFVHTTILVPYFSWKISHSKHHAKTGNVQLDEAFIPAVGEADKRGSPNVFWSIVNFVVLGGAGWILYMFTHIMGRDYGKRTDHFSPSSPLFNDKERKLVILNDVFLLGMLGFLGYLGYTYSFTWLLKAYVIPYLHVNFWLVMITLMHHTDRKLPHFHNEDWNWLQGAMGTVDRDYGWLLNTMFHHIGDTHVLHHLYSKIPHYHAQEATKAIIPVLGEYYCKDDTSVWKAMWTCTHECRAVYPDGTGTDKALWYDY